MFDFMVVVICLAQVILEYVDSQMPSLKMLRLVRVVRVLSLFNEFTVLNRIILAVNAALFPVLNSFIILLVVTCGAREAACAACAARLCLPHSLFDFPSHLEALSLSLCATPGHPRPRPNVPIHLPLHWQRDGIWPGTMFCSLRRIARAACGPVAISD